MYRCHAGLFVAHQPCQPYNCFLACICVNLMRHAKTDLKALRTWEMAHKNACQHSYQYRDENQSIATNTPGGYVHPNVYSKSMACPVAYTRQNCFRRSLQILLQGAFMKKHHASSRMSLYSMAIAEMNTKRAPDRLPSCLRPFENTTTCNAQPALYIAGLWRQASAVEKQSRNHGTPLNRTSWPLISLPH